MRADGRRPGLHDMPPGRLRAELLQWRSAAVIIGAALIAGCGQGLLWAAVAPGEQFHLAKDGGYFKLPTESYHQFTSIAIFLLLAVVVGVVLTTAAWCWRSVRGTTTLLVVVLANGLGALTAYLLGRVITDGVDPSLVGAALYTFLAIWNGSPDLGRPTGRPAPDQRLAPQLSATDPPPPDPFTPPWATAPRSGSQGPGWPP